MTREYIFSETFLNIPGTAERTIECPDERIYDLLFGRVILTCDATVADRTIYMDVIDVDGNVLFRSPESPAITASQTRAIDVWFGSGSPGLAAVIHAASEIAIIALPRIILTPGDFLRFYIGNGVAGDTYAGAFRILERGI